MTDLSEFVMLIVHFFSNISFQTFLWTICAGTFAFHMYRKLKRNDRHVKFAACLPGPRAFPVVGNGLKFFSTGADGMPELIYRYAAKYGTRFRLWMGKDLMVVLTDVKDIEVILNNSKTLEKSDFLAPFEEILVRAMSFLKVCAWRKARKRMRPFFVKNIQKYHVPRMREQINLYIESLKERVDGTESDVNPLFSDMSVDIVLKIFFDCEIDAADRKSVEFQKNIRRAVSICMKKAENPWLQAKFLADRLYGSQLTYCQSTIFDFARKKILKSKSEWAKETADGSENLTEDTFAAKFLSVLMDLEKLPELDHFTVSEISHTIAAGSEIMPTIITFVILMLAMHPDIQDKVCDEIGKFYDNDDRPVEYDDLDRFTYLEQVIKETHRKFSIVPLLYRGVEEDIVLGDQVFPAGITLLLHNRGVHLNPTYYPNPFNFDPENFCPEIVNQRSNYTYLPFSAGPRGCPAKFFADVAVKLILVTFLRKFRFCTTLKMEDIKLRQGFVVYNENGCPVSVKLR